jgi:LysR family transcriptional regulator (chromosome initiation inhibitor)
MFLSLLKAWLTVSMRFDPIQLETLMAIVEEGSFDGAARRLHVTPSAVSQRIRALEHAAGQVLVRRSLPAVPTAAGVPLVGLARQIRFLDAEVASGLGGDDIVMLDIAINADSLGTWFRPVMNAMTEHPGIALRAHVEDESMTHELLRRGEALAAVTSLPKPVQGCSGEALGVLRYIPAAAPSFLAKHKKGRTMAWATSPVVRFNEKDEFHAVVLAEVGATPPAVVHRIPTMADCLHAVESGLGWGMIPELQFAPGQRAGNLVRVPGLRPIDVGLHWQRWQFESAVLDLVTAAVRNAASKHLRPFPKD